MRSLIAWASIAMMNWTVTGSMAWVPFVGHLLVLAAYAAVGWLLAERAFARRLAS